MNLWPEGCVLHTDDTRVRVGPEDVAIIIQCITRDDMGKKLPFMHTSGVQGVPGDQWVEVMAGAGYRLGFFVREDSVTNCFYCVTPGGKEYCLSTDGGKAVFTFLKIDDLRAMTKLAITPKAEKTYEVRQAYIVVIDGRWPHFERPFEKEAMAEQWMEQLQSGIIGAPPKESRKIKAVKPEPVKKPKKTEKISDEGPVTGIRDTKTVSGPSFTASLV